MARILIGQILSENLPIPFAREPEQIEVLAIDLDPHRRNVRQCFEQLLIDENETGREPASDRNDQYSFGYRTIGAVDVARFGKTAKET